MERIFGLRKGTDCNNGLRNGTDGPGRRPWVGLDEGERQYDVASEGGGLGVVGRAKVGTELECVYGLESC